MSYYVKFLFDVTSKRTKLATWEAFLAGEIPDLFAPLSQSCIAICVIFALSSLQDCRNCRFRCLCN